MSKSVKVRAHTNLALVKYWGKKDEELFLPYNSSISMTLDSFYTDTEVTLLEPEPNIENEFLFNEKRINFDNESKVFKYADFLLNSLSLKTYKYKINSKNHVITSGGLASSSSGYAALTYAFCQLLKPNLSLKEISRLTRRGSGSSTRSIYGGFVKWEKGDDDSTSFSYPIDGNPTMDLWCVFVIFSSDYKKISSREGMKRCVNTSSSYSNWIKEAEEDLVIMEKAIKKQDFSLLGSTSERNALAMHQTTLDSNPSFSYFTEDTNLAIEKVRELRRNNVECYFTIDAGPNIAILTRRKDVKYIENYFSSVFPNAYILSSSFGEGVKVIK